MSASQIRMIIMDVDGVICSSGQVVPEALEILEVLLSKNIIVKFLTNDAISSRASRIEELNSQGLHININEIYTASSLTADYIRQIGCPKTLLLMNGEGVDEFYNIPLVEEDPEVVVVGDFFASYSRSKLERAFEAISKGSLFIAMQKNRYWMDGERSMIDIGFWVKGLEYCTGVEAKIVGKPSLESYQRVLTDSKCQPHEAIMVSDDLFSDLVGAKRAGLFTIHLQSTEMEQFPIQDNILPADLTINSLLEIAEIELD
ncbi:HAD-IIA family hydrolase [Longilinea arvoryzae]|nr:HAD-IIA family hydrolase [Longilinea arvoryzae]